MWSWWRGSDLLERASASGCAEGEISVEVGHPLFRLATNPPVKTRGEDVLRWLANEDPIVPAAGVDSSYASFTEHWRKAVRSDALRSDDGLRSELAYLAKSGEPKDPVSAGWIGASWLARRALPVWLDFLGMIGPAHALVATQPVREANRGAAAVAVQIKAARTQLEVALDEFVGAPAWRGPHEPVAAAIEVEAQFALMRTGAKAAAALAENAGRAASSLAELALTASHQAIATAGHLVADSMLTERGSLDPAVLSEIQHTVRGAIYVPALRLERAAKTVLVPEAKTAG